MNANATFEKNSLAAAARLARRAASVFVLALAAVWALAPAAEAQFTHAVRVKVPFAFNAGETSLPAGTYTIRALAPSRLVLRRDTGEAKIVSTTSLSVRRGNGSTRLVFNRYGDTYFLSRVMPVGSDLGYRVPAGETEARLASAGVAAQVVTVEVSRN